MDLLGIVEQAAGYAGTLNPYIVTVLFLMCAIGEFGFSLPYFLETLWILSGYNTATGILSPASLFLFWLAAQAGRQTGATVFYVMSRFGTSPLVRLYRKRFPTESLAAGTVPVPPLFRFIGRVNILSPFSVALARLFWMRIPVTIALSIRRKLTVLSRGIVLSSLAWDGTYIVIGAIGGNRALTPLQMVLYSLTGLTVLYVSTFAVRRAVRLLSSRDGRQG